MNEIVSFPSENFKTKKLNEKYREGYINNNNCVRLRKMRKPETLIWYHPQQFKKKKNDPNAMRAKKNNDNDNDLREVRECVNA